MDSELLRELMDIGFSEEEAKAYFEETEHNEGVNQKLLQNLQNHLHEAERNITTYRYQREDKTEVADQILMLLANAKKLSRMLS